MKSQNLDSALWKSFIGGEERTFNDLYQHFADTLFAFGLRYTNEQDVVRDAIQDLFIDLFKYRKKLTEDVNVKGYLFASLKRKITAALRKKSSDCSFENTDLSFHICFSAEEIIISDENQRELYATLQKELNQLPVRQQEVLYLRFNSELGYEQIAELMDISIATCRTLVYRAVKQLREKIDSGMVCYVLMMFFSQKEPLF